MLKHTVGAALALGVAFAAQADNLPGYAVRSTAEYSDYSNFSQPDPSAPASQADTRTGSGQTAAVLGDGYVAMGRTRYGHNQAYVRYDRDGQVASTRAGSAWYDQMTINGGTGAGTATFKVQLRGVIDAGRDQGSLGYTLSATTARPAEPQVVGWAGGWSLDPEQTTQIVNYHLVTSPYNDTSRVADRYGPQPASSSSTPNGIHTIDNQSAFDDPGMTIEWTPPDTILAPGAGQIVDLVLTGSFTFTYGEAFYLVGDFTAYIGDGLQSFTLFGPSVQSEPDSGLDTDTPTLLDFGNGAFLSSILLPAGASASFASGTPYAVATAPVPEPGEWALLLAGLGLVGWRARRRG